MKKFFLYCAAFLAATQLYAIAIIIDPGHGGKDTGVSGTYMKNGTEQHLYEKDITLILSKKLAALLQKEQPDSTIVLTRTDDSYIPLQERKQKRRSTPAGQDILFLSIHTNASYLQTAAQGFEVRAQKQAMPLAHLVSEQLAKTIGNSMPSRGVIDMSDSALASESNADILLNLGFLTNTTDAALLHDDAFLNNCASSLAHSINLFYK